MRIPMIMGSPKIVNKEIVYSDVILSLKEQGSDRKLTKLEDVSEYELNECLKAILERNKDVVFYTVQYSQKNKAIYFYTDKQIDLEFWGEGNTRVLDMFDACDILGYVDRIIDADMTSAKNHYSVEEIRLVMQDMYDETSKEVEDAKEAIKIAVSKRLHQYSHIFISLFNDDKEVTIKFERDLQDYEITFEKKDDDVRIKETELSVDDSLSILSKISKELKEFIEAEERRNRLLRSTASVRRWLVYGLKNVAVKLSYNSIEYYLYDRERRILFKYEFFHKEYYCCEKSDNIMEYMNGRMDKLFANTYISKSVIPQIILERLDDRYLNVKKSWIRRIIDKIFH